MGSVVGALIRGWLAVVTPSDPPASAVVAISTLPADDSDERVVAAVQAYTRAHGLQVVLELPSHRPSAASTGVSSRRRRREVE